MTTSEPHEHFGDTNGRVWEILRCDEHKYWWRAEGDGDLPDCPDPCEKCVYMEKSP